MKETSSLTTKFWLGFQTLNTIAKNNGSSKVPLISIEDLVKRGLTQKESAETFEALPSFSFVFQKEWPSVRPDGVRGNHFNITQLPSEVDVDVDGFCLDYQVSIHFKIGDQLWAKDVIMVMIKMRLKVMNIELGTRIGEPNCLVLQIPI